MQAAGRGFADACVQRGRAGIVYYRRHLFAGIGLIGHGYGGGFQPARYHRRAAHVVNTPLRLPFSAASPIRRKGKQLRNMLEARHLRLSQNSSNRRLLRYARFGHYPLNRRQYTAAR